MISISKGILNCPAPAPSAQLIQQLAKGPCLFFKLGSCIGKWMGRCFVGVPRTNVLKATILVNCEDSHR